jgi:hypothetical protein
MPTETPVVIPQPLPWWVSFTIQSGIAGIHQVLSHPGQAATLQGVLLQLRDAINAAYPGQ